MPFIKSFTINTDKENPFPYNIAAVKYAKQLSMDASVIIFVGDNGCGKSTLLESLAMKINLPLIGGMIEQHEGFEAARKLQPFINIDWKREVKRGFFFRAEDFSDFVNSIERENVKIAGGFSDLIGVVDDSIIERLKESNNYKLNEMRRIYGENMQAFSHGEAYLKILQTRIRGKGIYLLDEPEAALSPLKQLSLISFIMGEIKDKNAQFIISTHSPILMGFPNAMLYEILDDSMQQVDYKETDHYRITKNFLDNPEYYLRHL